MSGTAASPTTGKDKGYRTQTANEGTVEGTVSEPGHRWHMLPCCNRARFRWRQWSLGCLLSVDFRGQAIFQGWLSIHQHARVWTSEGGETSAPGFTRSWRGARQPACSGCTKRGCRRALNPRSRPEVFRFSNRSARWCYGNSLPGFDSSRIRRFLLSSVTTNRCRISHPMLPKAISSINLICG